MTTVTSLSVDVGANTQGAQQGFSLIDKAVIDMRNQILSLNNITKNSFTNNNLQRFTQNLTSSTRQVNNYRNVIERVGSSTRNASSEVSNLWNVFAGSFAANIATQAVNGFFSALDKAGKEAFDAYVSYENMTNQLMSLSAAQEMNAGNATNMADAMVLVEKPTQDLLTWMTDLALISIFREEDIANGLRTAQVFGFTQQEAAHLVDTMVNWGSATGATSDSLGRVIYALGQVNSLGHLTAAEVRQLANAGVPAMEYLSQATGKTTEELRKLMRQGAIPAEDAIQAIVGAMDRDFQGAAERMSHSMNGLVSSFKDLVRIGSRNLFGPTFEAVQPYLDRFVTWARSPEITGTINAMGEALADKVQGSLEAIDTLFTSIQSGASRLAPIGDFIYGTFSGVFDFIGDLIDEAFVWGSNFFTQLANGMSSSLGVITDALGTLGNIITYWLEPHSPPKLLPDLDKWGSQAATEWVNGWADADFSAFEGLTGTIEQLLRSMFDDTGEKIDMIDMIVGSRDAFREIQDMFNELGTVSEEAFARLRSAAGPAGDVAEQLARAYIVWQQESEKVAAAQLSVDEAARRVAEAELQVEAASREVAAAQRELADAHKVVESAEDRAEVAAKRVEAAQDRVSEATKAVTAANYELEEAQYAATDAQDALTAAMNEWQAQIDPLESQLGSVNNKMKDVKDEMRKIELQNILAGNVKNKDNELDRQLAALELEQIALEKSIRTKEEERDVATDALRIRSEQAKAEVDAAKRKVDMTERSVQALEREVDASRELEKQARKQVDVAKDAEKAIKRQVDAAKELEEVAQANVDALKEEEKAAKARLDIAKESERQAKDHISTIQSMIKIQQEDNKLIREKIDLQDKLVKEQEKAAKAAAKGGKGGGGAKGGPVLSPIDLSVPAIPKVDLSGVFDVSTGAQKAAEGVRRFLDIALEPLRFIGSQAAEVAEAAIVGLAGVVGAIFQRIAGGVEQNATTLKQNFVKSWDAFKSVVTENVDLLVSAIRHGLFFIQDIISGDTELAKQQLDLFLISVGLLGKNLATLLVEMQNSFIMNLKTWTAEGLKLISEWGPKLLEGFGKVFTSVIDIIGANLPIYIRHLKEWGFQLLDWLVKEGPNLLRSLGKLIGDVLDSIGKALPGIVEALAQWGKELWDWVVKNAPKLWEELLAMTSELLKWILDRAPEIAKQLGEWAIAFIKWVPGALADLILALGEMFGEFLAWILADEQIERLATAIDEWPKAFSKWVMDDAWPALKKGLGEFWDKIMEWFKEVGPKAWEGAKQIGHDIVEGIKQGVSDMWGDFKGWLGDIFLGTETPAPAKVPSTGGSTKGGFAGGVSYAPGGMDWVGEKGPELMFVPQGARIMPHKRSMAFIKESASMAQMNISQTINSPQGQGSRGSITVNVYPGSIKDEIDVRDMARQIAEEIQRNGL